MESRSSNSSHAATSSLLPIDRQDSLKKDCDEDTQKVIQEALKNKLQINEINDVEIDQEYRRDKFQDLYQIRGLLGVGAFGIVLECLNKLTNEVIALKIITLDSSKNLFQPELIEEEVLKELDHKNIIIFKHIIYSNFHVFIEMEKVNGGTLESFIKQKKTQMAEQSQKISKFSQGLKNKQTSQSANDILDGRGEKMKQIAECVSPWIQPDAKPPLMDEEIAASICRDICEGLNQIHKKNFIHRDLKPDNILIHENILSDGSAPKDPSERYIAKITDFGLSAEVHANVFNGSSNISEVMGTILFMAPEQATGKRYGKRIDMWALGIIMF